jgi:uncharacterized protein
MKRFTPTFYAPNLFAVPADFFLTQKVQYLFCDLDNTLAGYDQLVPDQTIHTWVKHLIDAGLTFLIVSNNAPARVTPYATALNVASIAQAGKPFSGKLLKFLQQKGYPKEEVMIIGDQLLTDVWLANRLGVRSLFVDKRVQYDHWPTKLNRILEAKIKRRLIRKQQLKHWEGKR